MHRFPNRQDENDRKQCMNLSSKVTNNTVHPKFADFYVEAVINL